MTNPTTGFGFQPSRLISGASPNGLLLEEQILSTYATKIHQFTPVIRGTDGYLAAAAATDAPVLGVLEGVEYYDTGLQQMIYSAAWLAPSLAQAGSVKAKIVPFNTSQLFKVRNNGTVLALADKGANFKLEANAGDDNTKMSKFRLDASTIATTNTFPFQLWDIYPTQGSFNDSTLDNNIVEVLAVNNTVTATTGKV